MSKLNQANNTPCKESISISLDENVISKIRVLAEKDDRSFSQYVNKVLKEHIKSVDFD